MNLYVVRHGEVMENVKGQINGWNDGELTKKGKMQAESASSEIEKKKVDLVICSPLKRTKQTCQLMTKGEIETKYDERIIERNTKSLMYKPMNILDFKEFYDPNKQAVYDDCEGFKKVVERVKEFINEIKEKYRDKNVLIVTHGDVCKAIHCIINNDYEINDIIKSGQNNCEIAEYKI